MKKSVLRRLLVSLALITWAQQTPAQGTAFTYQGQLYGGANPASGTYNLTFSLFNTNTNGTAIAGPVTKNAVTVTNGLFTVLVGALAHGAVYRAELLLAANWRGKQRRGQLHHPESATAIDADTLCDFFFQCRCGGFRRHGSARKRGSGRVGYRRGHRTRAGG